MPFSDRLKTARKACGFYQREVAERLGISERGYRFWENGQREPSIEYLIALADLLDVDLNWLLCRDEHQESSATRADER